jgi:hypothetical protein
MIIIIIKSTFDTFFNSFMGELRKPYGIGAWVRAGEWEYGRWWTDIVWALQIFFGDGQRE